jgi:hypothetical protein
VNQRHGLGQDVGNINLRELLGCLAGTTALL